MNRHLERYLSLEVLGRPPKRRAPKSRRRGLLAVGISYIQWPIRDSKFIAWVRKQPSVVSGVYGCDPCHTGSDGGMRLKASDRTCVPMTRAEHRLYHQIGKRAFERRFLIDFEAECQRLNAKYERLNP